MASLRLFLKVFVLFLSLSPHIRAAEREFSLLSFNTENLFDTEKSDFYNDADFTPTGKYEWTDQKLQWKLRNLSQIILSVENPDGSLCPDALALSEVENREVLELWKDFYLSACQYSEIIIFEPKTRNDAKNDKRGIKVALMSRYPILESPKFHLVYEGSRHILEVHLLIGSHPLILFINHWKSRVGGGEDKRILAAEFLRNRIQEILEVNPQHDLIALGDFNDEPENPSLRDALGLADYPSEIVEDLGSTKLYNVSFERFHLPYLLDRARELVLAGKNWKLEEVEAEVRKRRATYFYKKEKQYLQLDHFLLSRGLFNEEGLAYKSMSFEIIRPKKFTDENLAPIPFRPSPGGALGGASDHFAILMRMIWR